METDEDKIYSFLTTKQIKNVEVNHNFGSVYFYFEDGSKIIFVSLNGNIIIDFKE